MVLILRRLLVICMACSLAHCTGDVSTAGGRGPGGPSTSNSGGEPESASGNPEPGDIPPAPPIDDDGTVIAKLVASRVTGVAPLAVLFDATDTTGGPRPFHSLYYTWTFGDPNAGTWATTEHGKNSATGAITAHVFDKPGSYEVTLTVRNSEGKGASERVTITVDDPDETFAAETYCFSTSSDFADCPSGATQVTTSDYAKLASYATTGRRLLLHRGDTWTTTTPWVIDKPGPGSVGAFGKCVSADARGMCANAPEITSTTADIATLAFSGDWRVMDLKFSGITGASQQTGVGMGGTGALLYRVRTVGFNTGVQATFYKVDQDQLAIIDCDVGRANTNDVYTGAERLMLLGNHIHDSLGSHVVRVWHAYKSVIAENLIENSSIGGSAGRHALKLHGLAEGGGGAESGLDDGTRPDGGPLHRTQLTIVADNTFGASPPWPVVVGPQYVGVDERISDIILERNFWRTSGTTGPDAQPLDTPIQCEAIGDITVRNNIFDATGAGEDFAAMDIVRASTAPAPVNNVHFLNNLVYRSDKVGTSLRMVRVGAGVDGALIRNNLGVAPAYAASGRTTVEDQGTATVADHNAYVDDLRFADAKPALPFDFRPQAGQASLQQGAAAPVIDDYLRVVRPPSATMDLGPFTYVAP